MAQAKITNHTALMYETLFAADEKLKPIVTPIVKATFNIMEGGKLKFAEEQIPVNLEGEYIDDPESSSYRYEPETAFIKLNTDIVVLGSAMSTAGPVQKMLVEIQVGNFHKRLGIFGPRQWLKQAVGYRMSGIEPFESLPLIYENAFGGWDRRHEDESMFIFEARNTVGKGLYDTHIETSEALHLPNIENPEQLIQSIKDRPAPAGCGFTLPHWQPRAAFAGTYDDDWLNNAGGMLPKDFNRRFFNAASTGMVSQGYLAGNEPVVITNMTESGRLAFYLPGVKSPYCDIQTQNGQERLPLNLDTIIINTTTLQLQMLWRNYLPLTRSAHDVDAIDIRYG